MRLARKGVSSPSRGVASSGSECQVLSRVCWRPEEEEEEEESPAVRLRLAGFLSGSSSSSGMPHLTGTAPLNSSRSEVFQLKRISEGKPKTGSMWLRSHAHVRASLV